MNPCNPLITFSGSNHNHSVPDVKLKDEGGKYKNKKTNCLTAASASHNDYKEGIFFKLLNLCERERAKSDAYKYIHGSPEKPIVRTSAITASRPETWESR